MGRAPLGRLCRIAGCGRKHAARGVCHTHYAYIRRYGITPEQYAAKVAEQAGVCAICGEPERIADGRSLAVDHDHETGRVRGLLCQRCNQGLGHFGDDVGRMLSAVEYLRRYQSWT